MWINEDNPYEWTGGTNGDLKPLLEAVKAVASELLQAAGSRFAVLLPWSERNCLVHRLNKEDPTLREMGLLARYRGGGDSGSHMLQSVRIFIQRTQDARSLVPLPGVSPVGPDHLGQRFKRLDELEQHYLCEDPDVLPDEKLREIEVQCEGWHETAMMDFQDLVGGAGSDWRLLGEAEVDDGAYQVDAVAGFEPCVRVSGILSRNPQQQGVVLWYTGPMSFHQGFPNAPYRFIVGK